MPEILREDDCSITNELILLVDDITRDGLFNILYRKTTGSQQGDVQSETNRLLELCKVWTPLPLLLDDQLDSITYYHGIQGLQAVCESKGASFISHLIPSMYRSDEICACLIQAAQFSAHYAFYQLPPDLGTFVAHLGELEDPHSLLSRISCHIMPLHDTGLCDVSRISPDLGRLSYVSLVMNVLPGEGWASNTSASLVDFVNVGVGTIKQLLGGASLSSTVGPVYDLKKSTITQTMEWKLKSDNKDSDGQEAVVPVNLQIVGCSLKENKAARILISGLKGDVEAVWTRGIWNIQRRHGLQFEYPRMSKSDDITQFLRTLSNSASFLGGEDKRKTCLSILEGYEVNQWVSVIISSDGKKVLFK